MKIRGMNQLNKLKKLKMFKAQLEVKKANLRTINQVLHFLGNSEASFFKKDHC